MSARKNILIFRLGSLGDTIVALPSFHLIRQAYPDRKIYLLTNEPISGKAAPAMSILANSGLCDEAIAYPANLRDVARLSALRHEIRSHHFESAVHLFTNRGWMRSWRDCMFFRSCGIRKTIGIPPLFPPFCSQKARSILEQQCLGLTRKLHNLGTIDISSKTAWDLRLNVDEKKSATSLLERHDISNSFVVVSLGTKSLVKDWGDENWKNTLEAVSKASPQVALVMIGAADEFERSERIRHFWRGNSANLCGKCGPRISAAILETAALFVGHDSGPMHLAAATGTPVVAVFSWNNPPGYWFPGCSEWEHIKVFYPPLPDGAWKPELKMRRSPTEGILLVQPKPVTEMCLRLIR